jgi:hypothetical protein
LNQILKRQTSRSHYGSKSPDVTITVFKYRNKIGKIVVKTVPYSVNVNVKNTFTSHIDISKAFDRVWHIGLLTKIESIRIQGPLLSWMNNYLSNRKQRVVMNNSNSQWRDIKAGVPQGSIPDPLLFINLINDIVTYIQSTIKLFADNTSLCLFVDDPNEIADSINNDLTKIHDWTTKWLVYCQWRMLKKRKPWLFLGKKSTNLIPPLHGQQLHLFCFRTYTSWTSYFRQRELGKHIDRTTEKMKLRESIS